MVNLLVRGVDEVLVRALKERAGAYSLSAEAEHRQILEAALSCPKKHSFAELLTAILDVGTDADFQRVQPGRLPRVFN